MTGCLWPCAAAVVAAAAATTGSGVGRRGGGLFRSKAKGPTEVVRHVRELLSFVTENQEDCHGKRDAKRDQKMVDLSKSIRDMKCILYGNGEAEPVSEACTQLTKEFFKENTNTLHLLIVYLPYLDLETQKDVTQVVANLQRRKVDSRMVASDYLEANQDLLDILMSGYDNMDIAIHYSTMLRDCIRHQVAARYVLYPEHMKKFFDYIQLPDFNIASDAFKTFKELLTRHKSSAAEFFSDNYDWFFAEFNSKLLSSSNYIIRRQATQLLGDILLERSNTMVMVCYVSSKEHLIILMNLLRDSGGWKSLVLLGTRISPVNSQFTVTCIIAIELVDGPLSILTFLEDHSAKSPADFRTDHRNIPHQQRSERLEEPPKVTFPEARWHVIHAYQTPQKHATSHGSYCALSRKTVCCASVLVI